MSLRVIGDWVLSSRKSSNKVADSRNTPIEIDELSGLAVLNASRYDEGFRECQRSLPHFYRTSRTES